MDTRGSLSALARTYAPAGPQRLGELLDATWRIFRATALSCLPYGVLATVAGRLPGLWAHRPEASLPTGAPDWTAIMELARPGAGQVAMMVVGAVVSLIAWNATLLRQNAQLTRAPRGIALELADAVRLTPSVLALMLLTIGAAVLCLAPAALLPTTWALLAILVLSVPASWIGLCAACAWPVLVLERAGLSSSLRRGAQLLAGQAIRVSLAYTLATLGVLFFYLICISLVAVVVPPLAGGLNLAVLTAITTAVVVALGALITPFGAALLIAIYGDLRVRRDAPAG